MGSWENAFVNAEVYWALTLWSDLENLMGDTAKAGSYRRFAAGLKESYNKNKRRGGSGMNSTIGMSTGERRMVPCTATTSSRR